MADLTADLGARLAHNVRATREQRGLSQTQLAKRMGDYGLHWVQTTVKRIENLERRVGIAEAHALARALGVTVDALLADGPEHSATDQIRAAYQECEEAEAELERAQQRQLRADRQLALQFPAGLSVGEAKAAAKAALEPGG